MMNKANNTQNYQYITPSMDYKNATNVYAGGYIDLQKYNEDMQMNGNVNFNIVRHAQILRQYV